MRRTSASSTSPRTTRPSAGSAFLARRADVLRIFLTFHGGRERGPLPRYGTLTSDFYKSGAAEPTALAGDDVVSIGQNVKGKGVLSDHKYLSDANCDKFSNCRATFTRVALGEPADVGAPNGRRNVERGSLEEGPHSLGERLSLIHI